MTRPTILLQPVIHTTEAADCLDPATVHWDTPVNRYCLRMEGGDDIRVVDHDEDGHPVDEVRDLRVRLAAEIAAHAALSDRQLEALTSAAVRSAGGHVPLSLDEALAVHLAVMRWGAEEYADWANALAGEMVA